MAEYISPPLETNPEALVEIFHEYMEANVAGWEAAPGNLDERLGGAFSQLIAQLNEASSEGATNVFRYYGNNIVGIKPTEAEFAKGIAAVTAIDSLGHEIPLGTIIVWENNLKARVAFETTEAATIAPAATEVHAVPMRAVIAGSEGNGIEGNAIELVTSLPFVSKVELETPSNGGLNEEEDATYLGKLAKEFQLLTPKPILGTDFSLDLLNHPNVGRATTIPGFNTAATKVESVKIRDRKS